MLILRTGSIRARRTFYRAVGSTVLFLRPWPSRRALNAMPVIRSDFGADLQRKEGFAPEFAKMGNMKDC